MTDNTTLGKFEQATPLEQRIYTLKLLDQWEANYHGQCQLDMEADQRLFELDIIHESPICRSTHAQSGSSRNPRI